MHQMCKVCCIKTKPKTPQKFTTIYLGINNFKYIVVTVKYMLILFPFITEIFCNESKFSSLFPKKISYSL